MWLPMVPKLKSWPESWETAWFPACRVVARLQKLEQQGLNQVRVYPPLNRQYRVIEDFAEKVMSRL